jgi:metal-sulfur cluster biosynthetic enzyme
MKELEKVIDPEIGLSITAMQLIDNVKIDKDKVLIELHLTSPFCPLAFNIANDIKERVSKLDGVKSVRVKLTNHAMSEKISEALNK